MPHERARAIRVEVLNAPLDTIATLATVNIGALSRHERGASGALSPAAIERVEQILNDLIAVKFDVVARGFPDVNDATTALTDVPSIPLKVRLIAVIGASEMFAWLVIVAVEPPSEVIAV